MSLMCSSCKVGKVKSYYFSVEQAISICDNLNCDSYLDKLPWEEIVTNPIADCVNLDKYEQDVSYSSGVNSDCEGTSPSPTTSQNSFTDKEVELLLSRSHYLASNVNLDHQQAKFPVSFTDKDQSLNAPTFQTHSSHVPTGIPRNNVANPFDAFDDITFENLIACSPQPVNTPSFSDKRALTLNSSPQKLESPRPLSLPLHDDTQRTSQGFKSPVVSPLKRFIPSCLSAFSQVSPSRLETPVKSFINSTKGVMRDLSFNQPIISNNKGTKEHVITADSNFLSPASSGISEDSGFTDEDNCSRHYKRGCDERSITKVSDVEKTVNSISSHLSNRHIPLHAFEVVSDTSKNFKKCSTLSKTNIIDFNNSNTLISKRSPDLSNDLSQSVPNSQKAICPETSDSLSTALSSNISSFHNVSTNSSDSLQTEVLKNNKEHYAHASDHNFKNTSISLSTSVNDELVCSAERDEISATLCDKGFPLLNSKISSSLFKEASLQYEKSSLFQSGIEKSTVCCTTTTSSPVVSNLKRGVCLTDTSTCTPNETSSSFNSLLEPNKNFSEIITTAKGSKEYSMSNINNKLTDCNLQMSPTSNHPNASVEDFSSLNSSKDSLNELSNLSSNTDIIEHGCLQNDTCSSSSGAMETICLKISEDDSICPRKMPLTPECKLLNNKTHEYVPANCYNPPTSSHQVLQGDANVTSSAPLKKLDKPLPTCTLLFKDNVNSMANKTSKIEKTSTASVVHKVPLLKSDKKIACKYTKKLKSGIEISSFVPIKELISPISNSFKDNQGSCFSDSHQKHKDEKFSDDGHSGFAHRSLTKFKDQFVKDLWSIPHLFLDSLDIEVVVKENKNQSSDKQILQDSTTTSETPSINGESTFVGDEFKLQIDSSAPKSSSIICEPSERSEPILDIQTISDGVSNIIPMTKPLSHNSNHSVKCYRPIKLLPEVADEPFVTPDCSSFVSPPKFDGWRESVGLSSTDNGILESELIQPSYNNLSTSNEPTSNFDLDENFFTGTKPNDTTNQCPSPRWDYSPTPPLSDSSDSCTSFEEHNHLFANRGAKKKSKRKWTMKKKQIKPSFPPNPRVYHRKLPVIAICPNDVILFDKEGNQGIVDANSFTNPASSNRTSFKSMEYIHQNNAKKYSTTSRSKYIHKNFPEVFSLESPKPSSVTLNYIDLLTCAKKTNFGSLDSFKSFTDFSYNEPQLVPSITSLQDEALSQINSQLKSTECFSELKNSPSSTTDAIDSIVTLSSSYEIECNSDLSESEDINVSFQKMVNAPDHTSLPPSLNEVESNLACSSSQEDIMNALHESGWTLTAGTPDIDYSPPFASKSPTIIPLPLKGNYSDMSSVVLWKPTDCEVIEETMPKVNSTVLKSKNSKRVKVTKCKNIRRKSKSSLNSVPPASNPERNTPKSQLNLPKDKNLELFSFMRKMLREKDVMNQYPCDSQDVSNRPHSIESKFKPGESWDGEQVQSDDDMIVFELPDDYAAYQQICKEGLYCSLPAPKRPVTPPSLPLLKGIKVETRANPSNEILIKLGKRKFKEDLIGKKKKIKKQKNEPEDTIRCNAERALEQLVLHKKESKIPSMICVCVSGKTYVYHRDEL